MFNFKFGKRPWGIKCLCRLKKEGIIKKHLSDVIQKTKMLNVLNDEIVMFFKENS